MIMSALLFFTTTFIVGGGLAAMSCVSDAGVIMRAAIIAIKGSNK